MRTAELLAVLDEQDQAGGVWLYTPAMLRVLFPGEDDNALKMSLRRHVRSGLLRKVTRGLYANERARSAPADKLPALVPWLKPGALNYVSKENRLSQLGVISQMPLNHLAVMTSGSSWTFKTPYGTVEFTHTRRARQYILEHTQADPETGLLVADKELALKDLYRGGRNTNLVEEQEAKTHEHIV